MRNHGVEQYELGSANGSRHSEQRVKTCYKPVWNLEVEKKETALVGTSVWTCDGRLPMTAMSVKGRRLNTLWGVCTQRLQFAPESAVAPRVFLYGRCALKRKTQRIVFNVDVRILSCNVILGGAHFWGKKPLRKCTIQLY